MYHMHLAGCLLSLCTVSRNRNWIMNSSLSCESNFANSWWNAISLLRKPTELCLSVEQVDWCCFGEWGDHHLLPISKCQSDLYSTANYPGKFIIIFTCLCTMQIHVINHSLTLFLCWKWDIAPSCLTKTWWGESFVYLGLDKKNEKVNPSWPYPALLLLANHGFGFSIQAFYRARLICWCLPTT